ncbi:hypothetical protein DPMN_187128 [Dreissena polymorpha]|uniref:Uncharacterized protein n=1 Tax=Dreissena polymorpha TaxID=45954 RepID=A0A9D4DMR7_DREPO|nr:hypothetical protein DPMN_187128 [Dreissena polymorpha]
MACGKELIKSIKFLDSITKWSIQAIGITENTGACIATPKEVSAFKEFFIQVDLPYKVSRKEHFNVKVNVFNYNDADMNARVYLKGIGGLCYGSSPDQHSPPQLVTVPANGAKTLTFPMIPLEAGRYPIIVSAFVTIADKATSDIVEKQLLVVNEGIQEKMNFTVCLDPNNQMENCNQGKEVKHTERQNFGSPFVKMEVELPLPVTALPGTAAANAYIKSNLMGETVNCVLEGVDKMFTEPSGCGEQNMIRTAPIVYGMHFLKQTGTMETKHEDSGTTQMRNGITRQISMYHKDDGSFAAWKNYPTSLWLTAFVAKVFCQADQVVQGIVERDVINQTLSYIAKNNMEGSGEYRDSNPVIHREMQGVLAEGNRTVDPSLTAFVLTSLLECTDRTQEVELSVRRAMSDLERVPNNIIENNPYLLAITTYALAFSGSSKKEEFNNKLYAIKRDRGGIFWSNHNGAPNAYDVETTAYALLAFLKFDDFKTCHKIVAWLTQQNSAIGVWYTTQDTVVAMQALATYSARTFNPDTNLEVKIEKVGSAWLQTTRVNSETSQNAILNLPVDKDRKFAVTVSGRGSGVMKIEMFYNRKAQEDELCFFEVSPINVKDVVPAIANNPDAEDILAGWQCDVCGFCNEPDEGKVDYEVIQNRRKRQAKQLVHDQKCIQFTVRSKSPRNDAGMSIVRVNLETGVKVVESDLREMQENGVLPRYEMPSDGHGFVIIYLNSITRNATNLIFRLEDHFSGNASSRQPASIKVYDYYKPERSCMKQYGIGRNHGQEIKYKCDDRSDQCQCMQSQCVKQVNQELFEMALKVSQASLAQRKNLTKPVDALMDYACNFEKANYVAKVEVVSRRYDSTRDTQYAKANIKEAPLKGGQNMTVGDEIEFEWPTDCAQPDLKEKKIYYVIGKDGTAFNDAGGTSLKYELSGTALVIDPAYKPVLQIVMNNFVEELKTYSGCKH